MTRLLYQGCTTFKPLSCRLYFVSLGVKNAGAGMQVREHKMSLIFCLGRLERLGVNSNL